MPVVTITETGGLPPIHLEVPARRLSLTPASRICVETIGRNGALLHGTGIDWGSGSGCLAITAALVPGVARVLGIEVVPEDVEIATRNAERNGVADRVTVIEADLFDAVAPEGRDLLSSLEGRCDFLVANPPASVGDDGLGFRRAVLAASPAYLKAGAPILMQVSYQYGDRIPLLASGVPGISYRGVAGETDWVTFDMTRPDLAVNVADYAAEEARGGLPYRFRHPDGGNMTAFEAQEHFSATGRSPLSRWQMHLLRFDHPASDPAGPA